MRKSGLKRIKKLIDHRAKNMARVERVHKLYQPRIDKLIAKRDQLTENPRVKILRASTQIKAEILSLTGTELGQLRRLYPTLKELP